MASLIRATTTTFHEVELGLESQRKLLEAFLPSEQFVIVKRRLQAIGVCRVVAEADLVSLFIFLFESCPVLAIRLYVNLRHRFLGDSYLLALVYETDSIHILGYFHIQKLLIITAR